MTSIAPDSTAINIGRPRGAALRALLYLGAGWIGVRLILGGPGAPLGHIQDKYLSAPTAPLIAEKRHPNAIDVAVPANPIALDRPLYPAQTPTDRGEYRANDRPAFWAEINVPNPKMVAIGKPELAVPDPIPLDDIERAYAGQIGPLFLFAATDGGNDAESPHPTLIAAQSPAKHRPFNLYAYLYYRPNSGESAPFTLYGNSQIYARVDWRPFGGAVGKRASLYARASRDLTAEGNVETALGVSLVPLAQLPITLHAERRLRPRQSDANVAFISTGGTRQALPADTRLDWDGQAGYLAPDRGEGTPFFDAQSRVTMPISDADDWSFRGGVMAVAGGQKQAARLDIGPVFTVQNGPLHGQVGWRFRIAGDAEPKSGPAVTLSIGF